MRDQLREIAQRTGATLTPEADHVWVDYPNGAREKYTAWGMVEGRYPVAPCIVRQMPKTPPPPPSLWSRFWNWLFVGLADP